MNALHDWFPVSINALDFFFLLNFIKKNTHTHTKTPQLPRWRWKELISSIFIRGNMHSNESKCNQRLFQLLGCLIILISIGKFPKLELQVRRHQECTIWNTLSPDCGFPHEAGFNRAFHTDLTSVRPLLWLRSTYSCKLWGWRRRGLKNISSFTSLSAAIYVCTINIKPWGKKVDERCLWDNIRCYIRDIMWRKTLEMSPDRTAETRQSALRLF